jgi:hypothetical protein
MLTQLTYMKRLNSRRFEPLKDLSLLRPFRLFLDPKLLVESTPSATPGGIVSYLESVDCEWAREFQTTQMIPFRVSYLHHSCPDIVRLGFRFWKWGRRNFEKDLRIAWEKSAANQKCATSADIQGSAEFQELLSSFIHASYEHRNRNP